MHTHTHTHAHAQPIYFNFRFSPAATASLKDIWKYKLVRCSLTHFFVLFFPKSFLFLSLLVSFKWKRNSVAHLFFFDFFFHLTLGHQRSTTLYLPLFQNTHCHQLYLLSPPFTHGHTHTHSLPSLFYFLSCSAGGFSLLLLSYQLARYAR